jgi:hypothetical protein
MRKTELMRKTWSKEDNKIIKHEPVFKRYINDAKDVGKVLELERSR